MEEISGERPHPVIAKFEFQHVLVKRHDVGKPLEMHHDVPHAERARAEPRQRSSRPERIACDLGAVEHLEPVADRIVERDELRDPALVGDGTRGAFDFHPRAFERRGERVEPSSVERAEHAHEHLPLAQQRKLRGIGAPHLEHDVRLGEHVLCGGDDGGTGC